MLILNSMQINTVLSQEEIDINRESREFQDAGMQAQLDDARSTKTMSFVQMIFLPATAVAAVSSMDAFNWQKPGGGQYQPPFLVYIVISLCLTLLVLLMYRIFIVGRDRDQELEIALENARRRFGSRDSSSERSFRRPSSVSQKGMLRPERALDQTQRRRHRSSDVNDRHQRGRPRTTGRKSSRRVEEV